MSTYETPSLAEGHVDMLAMTIVQLLEDCPIGAARQVLRRAEFWIDATHRVAPSSTEFQKAVAALQASFLEAV